MQRDFINIFSDIRRTFAVSAALHLLFLLLFMLITVGFDFSPPEYAEISFVSRSEESTAPAPVQQAETPQNVQPRPPEPEPKNPEPTQVTERATPEPESASPPAPPIQLPQRRMLEDREPEIVRRNSEKLASTVGSEKIPAIHDRPDTRKPREVAPSQTTGEKIAASPRQLNLNNQGITPTSVVGGGQKTLPYSIAGEASEREVLKEVIPDYPEGLQKEAVIKIRFSVTPDGRVSQMIPVQKDYPKLEQVTLDALEQWRFNPLPPGTDQRTVQGIITFRFELQ